MKTRDELSPNNPRIRDAAKLRQKKFRRETGLILIEGARLVLDALEAGADIRDVLCTSEVANSDAGRKLQQSGHPATLVSREAALKLSDTRTPQGVFAVVRFRLPALPALRLGAEALALVADGVADPGNLGTIVRSAAALGADCVVATGDSCELLSPKVVRASMGALFRMPAVEDVPLAAVLEDLRTRGLQIVGAVARGGRAPWELDLCGPAALLVGSEAEGLGPEAVESADILATIPMSRGQESLNAAAAASLLLYEAARQRAVAKGSRGRRNGDRPN